MKKTACIWLAVLLLLSGCSSGGTSESAPGMPVEPTREVTAEPTSSPTAVPTVEPTQEVTPEPTSAPTTAPALEPTSEPSPEPTSAPIPTSTPAPTPEPTPTPESAEKLVYLLTRQAVYSPEGRLDAEHLYGYDAQGYILLHEVISYSSDNGSSSSRIWTYEYTGEHTGKSARCKVIDDRRFFESEEAWMAAQYEISVAPGKLVGYAVGHHHLSLVAYVDPLVENDRAAVLANGGVFTNKDGDDGWAYAVYTFDEAGNPVSILTYDETDTVIGAASLEWRLLDVS